MKSFYINLFVSFLLLIYCVLLFVNGIKSFNEQKPSISLSTAVFYIVLTVCPFIISFIVGIFIKTLLITALLRLAIYLVVMLGLYTMFSDVIHGISSAEFHYSGATVILFLSIITGAFVIAGELILFGLNYLILKFTNVPK